jgi:hypothetical protein
MLFLSGMHFTIFWAEKTIHQRVALIYIFWAIVFAMFGIYVNLE